MDLIKRTILCCETFEVMFLKYQSWMISRRYPASPERKPVVISLQNNIFHSAGLADRLRGMCAAYKVCKDLGYEYKIGHYTPFDLGEYLLPNKVDWRIEEKDIELDKCFREVIYLTPVSIRLTRRKSWDDGVNFYFNLLSKSISKVRDKRQIHLYGNLHHIHKEEIKGLFHELFKPTEELQSLLDSNRKKIGGSYISVSLRFRNLLGDFKDGNSLPLSEGEQTVYISKCLDQLDKIHQDNDGKIILVASDSQRFIDAVKEKSYVYIIPGEIGHVDNCGSDAHAIHLKTFLDLLTIAGAEKVYLIKTGCMYKSGFAVTAAAINARPYEMVEF